MFLVLPPPMALQRRGWAQQKCRLWKMSEAFSSQKFCLKSSTSKFVPQKFSQLTVSVGMSIEGPAVAFYPGAFWNVFDRWCYESENTTRGHLSFHNAHFEFISTFYHGKCSVWPLDPLGYFSTCCVPSVTFLGNFEHERFHEEIKMYKLGPELWA